MAAVSASVNSDKVFVSAEKVTDPKLLALFRRRVPALHLAVPPLPINPASTTVERAAASSLPSILVTVDTALVALATARPSDSLGGVAAVGVRAFNALRSNGDLFDAAMNFAPDGSHSINNSVVKPLVSKALAAMEAYFGQGAKRNQDCKRAAEALFDLFEDWSASQLPVIIGKIEACQKAMGDGPFSPEELQGLQELNQLKENFSKMHIVLGVGLCIFDQTDLKKSLILQFAKILRGLDKTMRLEQGFMMAQPIVKACLMTALGPAGFLTNCIPVEVANHFGAFSEAKSLMSQLQTVTKSQGLYNAACAGKVFLTMRFLEPIAERYMLIREMLGTVMLEAPRSTAWRPDQIQGRNYGRCASLFCDPIQELGSSAASNLELALRLPIESVQGSWLAAAATGFMSSDEDLLKGQVRAVVDEHFGELNPHHPQARLENFFGSALTASKAKSWMAKLYLAKLILVAVSKLDIGQRAMREFSNWWSQPSGLQRLLEEAKLASDKIGASVADSVASDQLGAMVGAATNPLGMKMDRGESKTLGATLLVAQIMTSLSPSGALKSAALTFSADEMGREQIEGLVFGATKGLRDAVQSEAQNEVFKLAFILNRFMSNQPEVQKIAEVMSAQVAEVSAPPLGVVLASAPLEAPEGPVVPLEAFEGSVEPSKSWFSSEVSESPEGPVEPSKSWFASARDALGTAVSGAAYLKDQAILILPELQEINHTLAWLKLQRQFQEGLQQKNDEESSSVSAAAALDLVPHIDSDEDEDDFEVDAVSSKRPDLTAKEFFFNLLLQDAKRGASRGYKSSKKPQYWILVPEKSLMGNPTGNFKLSGLNDLGKGLFSKY